MKIFGRKKEDIDKYALDFYSFGHLIFGHIGFIIIYLMGFYSTIPLIHDSIMDHTLGFAIFIGLFWELLENNLFIKTHLKKQKDSLNNSLCDILCVFIGASIIGIIIYFIGCTSMLFLLINTIMLLVYFMCFYILGTHAFSDC